MGKVKALLVGVSSYSNKGLNDLDYCRSDIYAMRRALIYGLKVNSANITVCGDNKTVTGSDFIEGIEKCREDISSDDTFILYFSGHGSNVEGKYCLEFSDKTFEAKAIIEYLNGIPAKNKIIFLDCCYSGSVGVDGTPALHIQQTAEEFVGVGYVVFASSGATEKSGKNPEKNVSVFTNCLCEALTYSNIIKSGKKSLNDIWKVLSLIQGIWNKNHPDEAQTAIFRANIGGTIFFEVEDYQPYIVEKFYYEAKNYIIKEIIPIHGSNIKKYAVKVILKQPFSFEEIAEINYSIVTSVKKANIYKNEMQEKRWRNVDASMISCLFGLDESDLLNSTYLCQTTWVDERQDKEHWYPKGKQCEVIKGIHFRYFSYYNNLKSFIKGHTGDRESVIHEAKTILAEMVTLAEKIIAKYREYSNYTIDEGSLARFINTCEPQIRRLYLQFDELDIPPDEIKPWFQACMNLASTVYDFSLYYGKGPFQQRTSKNRKQCMEMAINQYYSDLEKYKDAEKLL